MSNDDRNIPRFTGQRWRPGLQVDEIGPEPPDRIDEVWDATFEELQKSVHDSGIPSQTKSTLEVLKGDPEDERERLFQEGLREGLRRAFDAIVNLADPIKEKLMKPIYNIAFQDGVAAGIKEGGKEQWHAGYEQAKSELARDFEAKRKKIARKGMRVGYRKGVLDTITDYEKENLK